MRRSEREKKRKTRKKTRKKEKKKRKGTMRRPTGSRYLCPTRQVPPGC